MEKHIISDSIFALDKNSTMIPSGNYKAAYRIYQGNNIVETKHFDVVGIFFCNLLTNYTLRSFFKYLLRNVIMCWKYQCVKYIIQN